VPVLMLNQVKDMRAEAAKTFTTKRPASQPRTRARHVCALGKENEGRTRER
jgi:hypothetical protein